MNELEKKEKEKQAFEDFKTKNFFKVCQSEEELRAWFSVYFGLRFPMDTIDPDSTSNPIHAAYTIYSAVRDNTGDVTPGFIMLSSRDSYKTLIAAALETVILFHFRITIAHMAAIRDQSDKATSYVDSFVSKTEKYWKANGWKKISDSKKKTEFLTDKDERPYLVVIICTMAGANGEHCSLVVADELDVVRDPRAYDEAMVGIPSTYNNRHPIVVKLSTRKFAFGLMQKELDRAAETGETILRWNILDLSEKCPPSLHGGKDEVFDRYVANSLPLKQISVEEFDALPDNKKHEWSPTKAYKGCLTCPLLPVCKTKLADKPDFAQIKKTLYKSVSAVKGAFKRAPSPDIAEAQLLCRKPSSKGLVYPRFVDNVEAPYEETNTIKVKDAYLKLMGELPKVPVTHNMLAQEIKNLNLPTFAGLDWGYTKEFAFQIYCHMPWGDVWVLDTFGMPELELDDQVGYATQHQDKYNVNKWWVDPAYPANKKTFNKKGLVSPDFTKDVMGGIEALRGLVVDSLGKRRLKILVADPEVEEDKLGNGNQKLIAAFKVHHFKLDAQGNITKHPDDGEFADTMDGARYYAQNMHSAKGSRLLVGRDQKDKENRPESKLLPKKRTFEEDVAEHQAKLMQKVIKDSVKIDNSQPKTPKKRKGIVWNI